MSSIESNTPMSEMAAPLSGANTTVALTPIKTLLCPSESLDRAPSFAFASGGLGYTGQLAVSNYACNYGGPGMIKACSGTIIPDQGTATASLLTGEMEYLTNPVPGLKVAVFMEDANLTPILQRLIGVTSLPLRAIETVFAPDSTGFGTSRFTRWYDNKYGIEKVGRRSDGAKRDMFGAISTS